MMKRIILSGVVTGIFLSLTGVVFAEDTIPAPENTTNVGQPRPAKVLMEQKREELKNKVDDKKLKIASTTMQIKDRIASSSEKREEKREVRQEDRRELIKNMLENRFRKMFSRFQATIDRERSIMGKIDSRISKVKANGGDTTNAEKASTEAKMHLNEAQTALNLLKATATSTKTIDSETNASSTAPGKVSKETVEKLKNITSEIEKHLRNAHKSLENALRALKGNSSSNASTTPSSTSTSTNSSN